MTGTGRDTRRAAAATTAAGTAEEPAGGDAGRPTRAPVLRGFRVAHVFDISQTEGDPLPDITPELLTGDAPAALWDALAAQVAAHGCALSREACGQADGLTDPGARTVRVRPDVADAQAVKTLAHELAHIESGHTAEGYDYRGCRGRAEAEAGRGPRTGDAAPAGGLVGQPQGSAAFSRAVPRARAACAVSGTWSRPCPGTGGLVLARAVADVPEATGRTVVPAGLPVRMIGARRSGN